MKSTNYLPKINLNTSEAAHYLGIPTSELAGSRCSGNFRGLTPPKFIRFGKAVRYQKIELDKWNNAQPTYTSNKEAEKQA